jgi:hypothetical protein
MTEFIGVSGPFMGSLGSRGRELTDCGDMYDNESADAKPHEKSRVEETNTTSESNHTRLLCSRAEYSTKVVKPSDWSVIKSGFGIPNDGVRNQRRAYEFVEHNIVRGLRVYHFSLNNRV